MSELHDDELDSALRGAMKVLDDEVPSGYFEALADRALTRLEGQSMDTTQMTTGPRNADAPPPAAPREEDSGLHDIRNLAQSTKQRLSKKITAVPFVEDDPLATSSAGWKAVALPEPARMISLPELDQLPTKKQLKEQEKAAAKKVAVAPAVVEAGDEPRKAAAVAVPATAAASTFGAHLTQPRSKTPLYALVGVGLAAAAGGLIYVATRPSGTSAPAPMVAKAETPPPAVTAQPIVPPPAPAAVVTPIDPGSAAAPAEVPAPTPPPVEVAAVETAKSKKPVSKAPGKPEHRVEITNAGAPETKSAPTAPAKAVKEAAKDGEPSFDDLLKEAGVKDGQKVAAKPKLDKKSLSSGDFKTGMSSIAGAAKACYAGTQGTASVKLSVGPDGHVSKASVTGAFAGTPVGSCVEAAVRGASFPAWDGGPQSFNYSFLLSD